MFNLTQNIEPIMENCVFSETEDNSSHYICYFHSNTPHRYGII